MSLGRAVIGAFTAGLVLFAALAASAQDTLRIAAIVNDEIITGLDLSQRTRMAILSSGLDDTAEAQRRFAPQVLRAIIDERLKLQEAVRRSITVSQEEIDNALARVAQQNNVDPTDLEEWLLSGGMLLSPLIEQIRANIAWGKLVRSRLGPTVSISDEEVNEVLQRVAASEGRVERRVSEIFLAVDSASEDEGVRQTAERLMEQLRTGADFASVAVQFSDSATAAVGGDVGWVQTGQLPEDLESALAGVPPDNIVGPIRTFGGYHILFLRDMRTIAAGSVGPDRDEVQQSLQRERLDLMARRYLRDLRRAAFVDIRA